MFAICNTKDIVDNFCASLHSLLCLLDLYIYTNECKTVGFGARSTRKAFTVLATFRLTCNLAIWRQWGKGCTSLPDVQFVLTVFKMPLTPPSRPLEQLVDFFPDWKPLCTALRLDNARHRSEKNMSNIPWNPNNSTLKESFCVSFK